jgi:diguanylate cyclase (GGDEF)-like protein
MRFVRVGALVGSLVLIVATLVSILNGRSDARDSIEEELDSAATISESSFSLAIDNATALAEVAAPDVDPDDLRLFQEGVEVCVMPEPTAACEGDDLASLDGFEVARQLSAAEGGRAVSVADQDAQTIVVVSDRGHVVAIGFDTETLLDPRGIAALVRYAGSVEVATHVIGEGGSPVNLDTEGRPIGVDRVSLLEDPPEVGALEFDYRATTEVGLTGGSTGWYLVLLGLGTALLLVAGWTYFSDRRSLERMATTDDLTGLVTRREFARITEEAVLDANRLGTGLCVMLIDLDAFKAVNDDRGHHMGDQVLIECADRLRASVRDTDVVGRWGGDEFVVLLPGLESGSAVRSSAERIGAKLAETPIVDDLFISGSIGAAVYPRHGGSFEVLMRAADDAMYNAKTTGVTYRMADAIDLDEIPDFGAVRPSGEDRRPPRDPVPADL